MIHHNATLVSLATPRVSDGSGGFTAGTTTALNGVRCLVDRPSDAVVVAAAGKVSNFEAVLYVLFSALPAGVAPVQDGVATYQLDGAASVSRKVARLFPRVKEGGLSHWELWLVQQ